MTKRQRRDPDEARKLILDAARDVISRLGPDSVRLKDVAKEAGVSRALVSHYFGKIHDVIEAAFEAHIHEQRDRILSRLANTAEPRSWFRAFFDESQAPLHARLIAWSMISGRAEADDFFPIRNRGTKVVVDAIEARLIADGTPRDREEIETHVIIAIAATMGYSIGRKVLWAALGRRASKERDAQVRERLADMLFDELGVSSE